MKYLLDTCVISEAVKPKPNDNVIQWLKAQDESNLYLSALTLGEIVKGIEKSADTTRKERLKLWIEADLTPRFKHRILPINLQVATKWGEVQGMLEKSGQALPAIDGLIAATGIVNHCIVVTRNIADMQQSAVELFNPW